MELQPGKNFTIVRQLGMPGDVATYYVQAVVKNSSTGATIEAVNLTDNGSQRFTGVFQVPQDTSGQGLNIDITTTVYTDSGYSTQSNIYTIDNSAYLVFDRLVGRNIAVGGFGADNVDYKRVKKIVEEVVATIKVEEARVEPKNEVVDLSPVLNSISAVMNKIDAVDTKSRDTSILSAINKIKADIKSAVDIKDIHSKLNKIYEVIYAESESNNQSRAATSQELKTLLNESKALLEKVDETIIKTNTYSEDVKLSTDKEKMKELKNYIGELGNTLTKVFKEQFVSDENQAKNLMNAFVRMSTQKELKQDTSDSKVESPYLEHANKLLS